MPPKLLKASKAMRMKAFYLPDGEANMWKKSGIKTAEITTNK